MKKTFDFGKIDYTGKGRKNYRVTVGVEYREKEDGRKEFAASAEVWNPSETDIVMGGQCLDELKKYVHNPVFDEIYRLWRLYHLNTMHPECEHQAALGWVEEAQETVTTYRFTTTLETSRAQRDAKRRIVDVAKTGESVKATPEELRVLSLDYFVDSETDELPETIARFYKLSETKKERRGFIRFDTDSRGILCKPCPVCGYEYGSSWKYFPIPEEDEEVILKLFEKE